MILPLVRRNNIVMITFQRMMIDNAYDLSIRLIGNNNNSSSCPSKRANLGDITSNGMQDQVDFTMIQPSQVANSTGNFTTHAMKGGQKLTGKLYDVKK
jgi:hypothetical protein